MHFACVLTIMASYQPSMVTLAPVCSVWSKVTEFAFKSPTQMKVLTKACATQIKLINGIGLLIHVVMPYGGRAMIGTLLILNDGTNHS